MRTTSAGAHGRASGRGRSPRPSARPGVASTAPSMRDCVACPGATPCTNCWSGPDASRKPGPSQLSRSIDDRDAADRDFSSLLKTKLRILRLRELEVEAVVFDQFSDRNRELRTFFLTLLQRNPFRVKHAQPLPIHTDREPVGVVEWASDDQTAALG